MMNLLPENGEQHCSCCSRHQKKFNISESINCAEFDKGQFNSSRNPVRISVDVPGLFYRKQALQCESTGPQYNDTGKFWRSTFLLSSGEDYHTYEDKSVETDIINSGQTENPIAMFDFRVKESLSKDASLRGDLKEIINTSSNEEDLDWSELERLEMETWSSLSADPTSPVKQNSFFRYLEIVNSALNHHKHDLADLERKSEEHYQKVRRHLSKDDLLEIVYNRTLRKDAQGEINFITEQLHSRAIMFKRKLDGKLEEKQIIDLSTCQERFARATRAIGEILNILKEQVDHQFAMLHCNVEEKTFSEKKNPEEREHFV